MSHRVVLGVVLLLFGMLPGRDSSASDLPEARAVDSVAVRDAVLTVKGQRIEYRVTVGSQPHWGSVPKGPALASVSYFYYERKGVRDRMNRPLLISFGEEIDTASASTHLGYSGPKVVRIDKQGGLWQPYGEVEDNVYSVIDVADLLYIDPVRTGFSKDADTKAMQPGISADWFGTFLNRHGFWSRPKYVMGGEVATSVVSMLQEAGIYVSGLVLVAPSGLKTDADEELRLAYKLPHYAATAWYHKVLAPELQQKALESFLAEVESFTLSELAPALLLRNSLSSARYDALLKRVSHYTGMREEVLRRHGLAMKFDDFQMELLSGRGLIIGLLDSRYAGFYGDRSRQVADQIFTSAINRYLREELGVRTEAEYQMGQVESSDERVGQSSGILAVFKSMSWDPQLHVLIQAGYFDGGGDYFNAKRSLWEMDPEGPFKGRISLKIYRTGHLLALHDRDRMIANEDLRAFILQSLPRPGEPAKFSSAHHQ